MFDTSLLWIVLAAVGLVFGSRWAVMQRANSDYKKVKAGLPGMRSTYWHQFWRVVRVAILAAVVLAGFAIYDLRGINVDANDWLSRLRDREVTVPRVDPERHRPRNVDHEPAQNGRVICFSAECRRRNPE